MKKKESKSKTKQPEGTLVTKEFMFKLTDAEAKDRLQAAGALHEEIQQLMEKFAEVKKTWNEKIKARTASRDEILVAGNSGEEKRTVEAIMVKDFNAKEIQFWFDGAMIEQRAMTDSECQMEVNFSKEEKKARGTRQKLKHADPVEAAHAAAQAGEAEDIDNVRRLETSRHSKHNALDGPA